MAVEVISGSYIAGFKGGAESVIDMLLDEFPGLEEPEYGGPISEARERLAVALTTFAEANGR